MFDLTLRTITLTTALIFLSGCYSGGNSALDKADETSIATTLIKGVTTKQEVVSAYGSPMSKSPTADGETWLYQYTKGRAKGTAFIPGAGLFTDTTTYDMKQLTILFQSDGTVSSYTWNDVEDLNNQ